MTKNAIYKKRHYEKAKRNKICHHCGKSDSSTKRGKVACLKCFQRARHWERTHPEIIHFYQMKKLYGITKEIYQHLFSKQKGKCAICKSKKSANKRYKYLCIDHDHNTKKIRGLLCNNCNMAIGKFHNAVLLKAALSYLKNI